VLCVAKQAANYVRHQCAVLVDSNTAVWIALLSAEILNWNKMLQSQIN